MKTVRKVEKMVFKNHYSLMSEEDRTLFRDTYTNKSGMPQATFYQKLNNGKFRLLEQALFGEMLREFYSGKKKIIITGKQGSGKTVLAKSIAEITGLPLFDELSSVNQIKDVGIYVSNSFPNNITELEKVHIINMDNIII